MRKLYIIILSFLLFINICLFIFLGKKSIYFNLKGNEIIEVTIGEKFKDPGYIALDCPNSFKLFCKNIKKNVDVKTYETSNPYLKYKSYTLIYNDKMKVLKRTIKYVDKESPTIELINNESSRCPNSEYIEEGYKAYDNIDGDITDKVSIKKTDDKIYYSVSDNANNKKVVYRDIKSNDTVYPNITLNGSKKLYLFLNQEYNEKGYTANDNCDGDITGNVKITNNLDTSKIGNYKINYTIQDSTGNKTTESREVIVYKDISNVPKNGKVVYLTFDDGPCTYTEDIIKVLKKYNVKATFFVTNQFSKYQSIIKKEYDSGHTVAVHTYSHNYDLLYSSLDNYLNDFNQMNEIIYKETGIYSNLFRFPGGSSNTISRFNRGIVTSIANKMTELGYNYFDWNVDSNDTGTTDPNVIYNNVINEIEKNDYSVVLMHDIKKANVESVDKIIEYGLNNGYTFLPLDENSPTVHHKINN